MDDDKTDLSTRYYIAEASVWLLGGILTVARFVGLAPSQSLPLLNVTPEKQQYFPQVLAILLVATTFYVLVEWRQSTGHTHRPSWARARVAATSLWACASLWMSYSLIAQGTRFVGISPGWYIAFLVVGLLVGVFTSMLTFFSLMIRTPSEAKTLHLPRVPVATRAQYFAWGPVLLLLFVAYYVLWHYSPEPLKGIGSFIVALAFVLVIVEELVSLCFSKDEHGIPIPYNKRVARLKKIPDSHDYEYFLHTHSEKALANVVLPANATPQAIQQAMQKHFSAATSKGPIDFHVEQLEEMQITMYAKDGNQANHDPNNCGVSVKKAQGKRESLRVMFIPVGSEHHQREYSIPLRIIESLAEEFIVAHNNQDDLSPRKIFSYAINETVIHTMLDEVRPLLFRAIWAGQDELVRDLLKKNETNVNERAEYGWTALLAASAQGYPNIVKDLLEAAAAPDLGNVKGITPLMYSARYGNCDVTRLLIEYHARTDIQDVSGNTALMLAAREGQDDVVKMLLDAGADPTIQDSRSMTALDWAQVAKAGKIARRLRESMRLFAERKAHDRPSK